SGDGRFGERNALRTWIEIKKVKKIIRARDVAIRRDEVRIAFGRFVESFQSLKQRVADVRGVDISVDAWLCLKVKFERVEVLSWPLFDVRLLLRRKPGFELGDNRLGQLALDCEQIGRAAIVSFSPDVTVISRVDQLRIDTKTIAGASDGTFYDVSDTELAADLAHVAFGAGLVLTHTRVADHLQIGNLRKIRQ